MQSDQTQKKSKKSKKVLPAHVLQKFRENNEQQILQSQVRKVIDDFTETLEVSGEVRSHTLFSCSEALVKAVVEHFSRMGWRVLMDSQGNTTTFTIWLED